MLVMRQKKSHICQEVLVCFLLLLQNRFIEKAKKKKIPFQFCVKAKKVCHMCGRSGSFFLESFFWSLINSFSSMGHSAKNYKLSVVGTIPLNLESFSFPPSLPPPSYYCLHLSSIDPFPAFLPAFIRIVSSLIGPMKSCHRASSLFNSL